MPPTRNIEIELARRKTRVETLTWKQAPSSWSIARGGGAPVEASRAETWQMRGRNLRGQTIAYSNMLKI